MRNALPHLAVICLAWLVYMPTSLAAPGAASDWSRAFRDAGAAPKLLGEAVICTGDDESHPTLAPDSATLYFLKNTPSFDFWTIVTSEWRGGRWSPPRTASFSGQYADADIVFTPDGRRAYFVSLRPVDGRTRSDTEIWTVERQAEGWGEPRHVKELSSPGDEWFPTLASNGTLYFGSSRPGGAGGTDIWRARYVNGVFAPPENLGAPINSPGEEIEAFITPDEKMLIIAAKDRGDVAGSYDLYVAHRSGEEWRTPRRLDEPLNSPGWDFSPRLSPDGKVFLFTSNRGFGAKPQPRALKFEDLERRIRSPRNGLRDIYYVDASVLRASE